MNGTLREHLIKYIEKYPLIIEVLIRFLYVDDFTGGGRNKADVIKIFNVLVDILKEANFVVHKFRSNDVTLNAIFNYNNEIGNKECEEETC